jgi:acyl-CoA synthetase (AMP-forming)/AMP-acid ligase II
MDGSGLLKRLEGFPGEAMVWRDRAYSYGDMLARVGQWREELANLGIRPGECVAMSGDFSPGTTSLLLALVANRNIAVPLTASLLTRREQEERAAYCRAVFRFDRQDAWRFEPRAEALAHPLLDQLRSTGSPGLILYTSGSSGKAKAALHDFQNLLARFEKKRRAFRMLTFLLLDHMGGINTLLSILCHGGVAVTAADRSVDAICRVVEQHRIELLPATPTFLNMLLISQAQRRFDLSSLKYVSYGTEPMPQSTLQALRQTLPQVEFRQLYGLTELGILPSKTDGSDELRVQLGGEGCEVRVVDGLLWIRSSTAMLGYLNAPSPFDAEGWFNTGDAVVEENGYLKILGRESELINVGGEKVFPAEIEDTILQVENVRDVAVSGKPNPLTGSVVVARVALRKPEVPKIVERRIRQFCKARLASYKIPVMVEVVDDDLHGIRFKKQRSLSNSQRKMAA